ncbi:2-amino-4-hydroxy-6- hydroxymethyldihydropteridine pyrophosphokinase [Dinoroseobacter shibae DFL 12 = DSM 16493]|jgi:2-amino-4-hydroxy-6-hydroxymethyldihydropteridine diphosphokinase|uniref:2-amino-4-hydroxy-6-hydroxymethyldihydropteridine pyrophosphokinase n=1 Tax=Dinoroseobacter shibae (strain DSM 16493 / NCIMB 14021 / DFL 12) TaxID=398580 RepID=A8LLD1_DINSH|nr:2-amino-4-hydroxy-6-hydroxymethyldihydropteridine diphosphokinase [Dinoroseobacter shibae]ABV91941.1 2-amino-4-hydroxy-6- hydroxymethyldihydropteridine pyrophosphokinase [Dinoroseobacter shibae DFL 12 = DSM 16493]URF46915.1 2-amino-4-hydroxy-6-hydroxymethyldihydropteridine diphosphokinase [Dinoroseobacter shibae]URF51226.1 2-amino-4-hydroxy-6-hydroxymethyldihydropteridine diphosphokinase [Dinoroseobacter shibae]
MKIQSFGIIALGANQPLGGRTPKVTLRQACEALADAPLEIVARSRFFATPAFPDPSQPEYVNGCVTVETGLGAKALLKVLHDVEDRLGRARGQRWGARTLDLDLLALGAQVLPDMETYAQWRDLPRSAQVARTPNELILPHPRIADRPFVLVPLMDVAPLWRHPVTGKTASEMLRNLPKSEIDAIRPLE